MIQSTQTELGSCDSSNCPQVSPRRARGTQGIALCTLLVLAVATAPLSAQNYFPGGLAGTGGILPSLSTNGPWMGNWNHMFEARNAQPWAPGAIAISFARDTSGSPLVVDLGTPLFALTSLQADIAGYAALPLPFAFPAASPYAGLPFYTQCGFVDTASPIGLSLSKGLACRLGWTPAVFMASSVAGAADPWWLLDPYSATYAPIASGTNGMNNVTSAAFVNGGAQLWASTAFAPYLRWMDLTTSPPTVTTIPGLTAAVDAVHYDSARGIIYAISSSIDMLSAYDVNSGPSYGTLIGQSTGLGFGLYIASTLGNHGTRLYAAAALTGLLKEIDTDPSSPTWLSLSGFAIIPYGPNQASVMAMAASDAGTPQVLIALQAYGQIHGELARYDCAAQQFIDHNPTMTGRQNIGAQSVPAALIGIGPSEVAVASDCRHAAISAAFGGGQIGFLTLDPANAATWAWTLLSPGVPMTYVAGCSFLPDNTSIAFTSWSPSRAMIMDIWGNTLQNTPLGGGALNNIYTCVAR